MIASIDFSADGTLLGGGSRDSTARIWSLDTGKLVAGPFNSPSDVDLTCFGVWDVETQKLVKVRMKENTVVSTFTPDDCNPKTIYEFDASTLETVGAPFEGHTRSIGCLALSFDGALLVSACHEAIKFWAFESCQLLASFNIYYIPFTLILSPDFAPTGLYHMV